MSHDDDSSTPPWGLTMEALEAVFLRVYARQREKKKPVSVQLPLNKREFPKMLCLDFNKWVDLGRAYYGVPEGQKFRDALASIQKAVASGRLIVPVSGANAHEVMAPQDEGRRRRLASFMVELSRNHSLVHTTAMPVPEIRSAVRRTYLGHDVPSPIRPYVVRRGMSAAIVGADPKVILAHPSMAEIAPLLDECVLEPEISIAALTHLASREMIRDFRSEDVATALALQEIQEIDAHLSRAVKLRLELSNFLNKDPFLSSIRQVLAEFQVGASSFFAWLEEDVNLLRFAAEVPALDIMSTLSLARWRSRDEKPHRNDGEDMAFLHLGIAYSNVVITEKSWAHFSVATGLCKRYGTIVVSDLTCLPSLLAKLGCE